MASGLRTLFLKVMAVVIKVEIRAEMEARLAERAKAEGLRIEQYAEKLLENAIAVESSAAGLLSPEEILIMLDAIGEGSGNLPRLPTAAFRRESFYEGRP